jgi:hypothetical protein
MTLTHDPPCELRERFPGRRIWQTPIGHWWTFRKITQLRVRILEELANSLAVQAAKHPAVPE